MGKVYNVFKRHDIGIAVRHFNHIAKELGITGKWSFEQPDISTPEDLQYIISWYGDNQFNWFEKKALELGTNKSNYFIFKK